jgi:hypothetical protein
MKVEKDMSSSHENSDHAKMESLSNEVRALRDQLNMVGIAVSNASGHSVNPILHGFDEIAQVLKEQLAPLRNIGPQIQPLPVARAKRLEEIKAGIAAPSWSNISSIATFNPDPVPFIGDLIQQFGDDESAKALSRI